MYSPSSLRRKNVASSPMSPLSTRSPSNSKSMHDLRILRASKSTLEYQLHEKENELKQLKDIHDTEMKSWQTRFDQSQARCNSLSEAKSKLAAESDRCDQLSDQLNEERKQNGSLKREITKSKEVLSEQQYFTREMKLEYEDKLAKLEAKIKELGDRKEELSYVKQQNRKLDSVIQISNKKVNELEDEIEQLIEQQSEAKEIMRNNYDIQISDLEERFAEENTKCGSLESVIWQKGCDLAEAVKKLEASKKELDRVAQELCVSKQNCEKMSDQLNEERKQNDSLKGEMAKSQEELSQHQKTVQEMKLVCEDLMAEVDRLSQEISVANENCDQLSDQVNEERKENDSLKGEVAKSKELLSEQQYFTREMKLEYEDKLEAKIKELGDRKEELSYVKQQNRKLDSATQISNKKVNELEDKIEQLIKQQSEDKEIMRNNYDIQISDLEERFAEENTKCGSLESVIWQNGCDLAEAVKKLEASKKESDRVAQELCVSKQNCDQLSDQLNEERKQNDSLKSEITKSKELLSEQQYFTREMKLEFEDKLEAKIKELGDRKEELSYVKQQNRKLDSVIQISNKKVSELEDEIEQLIEQQSEAKEIMRNKYDTQISDLEERFAEENTKCGSLESVIWQNGCDLAEAVKKLEASKKELDRVAQELCVSKQNCEKMSDQLNEERNKNDSLKGEMAKSQEELSQHQKTVQEMKLVCEDLMAEVDRLSQEISVANENRFQMKNEFARLEEVITEKDSLIEGDFAIFRAQMTAANRDVRSMLAQTSEHRKMMEDKLVKIENEAKMERDRLTSELDKVRKELSESEEKKQHECQRLSDELNCEKEKNAGLNKKVSELEELRDHWAEWKKSSEVNLDKANSPGRSSVCPSMTSVLTIASTTAGEQQFAPGLVGSDEEEYMEDTNVLPAAGTSTSHPFKPNTINSKPVDTPAPTDNDCFKKPLGLPLKIDWSNNSSFREETPSTNWSDRTSEYDTRNSHMVQRNLQSSYPVETQNMPVGQNYSPSAAIVKNKKKTRRSMSTGDSIDVCDKENRTPRTGKKPNFLRNMIHSVGRKSVKKASFKKPFKDYDALSLSRHDI